MINHASKLHLLRILLAVLAAGLMLSISRAPRQVFAASAKSVTIYTSDYSSGFVSSDFSTSFGVDTLISPAYATGCEITWKSSDRNVADVDEHGHVLGLLTGPYSSKSSASCTVTATLRMNGKTSSDKIKVTVKRGKDITGNYFTNSTGSISAPFLSASAAAFSGSSPGSAAPSVLSDPDPAGSTLQSAGYVNSERTATAYDADPDPHSAGSMNSVITAASDPSASSLTEPTGNGTLQADGSANSGINATSSGADPDLQSADSGTVSSVDDPLTEDAAGTGEQISESLRHDHVEGELIVVFDSSSKKSEIRKTLGEQDARLEQITEIDENEKAALATVESEEDLAQVMEQLADSENVAYVQPNYIYKLDTASADPSDTAAGGANSADAASSADPTDAASDAADLSGTLSDAEDPYYDARYQYFHTLMDTKGAWDLLEKNGISQSTIVGVIDSGVDADHADLAGNLILEDGKFRSYSGSSYEMTDSDIVSNGHGTHVAGIIAGVYGNGRGGAGAASGIRNDYCKVLPVRIVGSDGTLDTNSVINGISHAVASGARVINLSFGSDVPDRAVGKCISANYYNNNIVFVGSAGNKDSRELGFDLDNGTKRLECHNYPADMKEVIAVCNIDRDALMHVSSYTGLCKDVSAPGTLIYSTIPYNSAAANPYTYGALTGTSMSAPMVSAVAALMLDANPDLTPAEVRNIICGTAVNDGDYYTQNEMGYGRVDARACVEAAYKARDAFTDAPSLSIKAYYAGEPEPYVTSQRSVSTITRSVSRVPSTTVKGAKRSIQIKLKRASLVTETVTETTSKYFTGLVGTTTTRKETSSTSGVRYQVYVQYGAGVRTYSIAAKKKKTGSVVSYTPKKSTVSITIKKFGSGRLRSGRTCYVAVRAYKKVNEKYLYSKWSKLKKVRIK